METLENINMKTIDGATEVLDGAGIIPKGIYLMTQREVKQMVQKKKTPQYLALKIIEDTLKEIEEYQ